ncbi:MAG: hypothetical protein B2I17_07205 [Thermoplasmatales archaeon B_DKE]|nr:MAG: hypothetical protein B2I17_07205 [Thermoplasmatales archaeon B_DKE]
MCYNRKKFISEAILSAINQDFPRDQYEIIVTKNYSDDAIDTLMETHGIIGIHEGNVDIGNMIVNACSKARGEFICFLDDDDRFHKDKLRRIFDTVSEHSDIVYYHNSFRMIDTEGLILADYEHLHPSEPQLYNSLDSWKKISMLKRKSCDINMSSITIKKDFILERREYIDKINGLQDVFLFYLSAMSNRTIFLDSDFLTDYRVHTSESHGDTSEIYRYATGIENILLKYLKSYEILCSIKSSISNILRYEYVTNKCRLKLISAERIDKITLSELTYLFVNLQFSQNLKRELFLIILGFLHKIFPKTISHIYLVKKIGLEQSKYSP